MTTPQEPNTGHTTIEAGHAENAAQSHPALLDDAHLATITGGDTALALDVLNIFSDNASAYVRKLREAQSSDDWHDAAHTLKGSARGIGAWQLADLCERAEKLSSKGGPADRSIALGDISCAVSKVVAAIAVRCRQMDLAS